MTSSNRVPSKYRIVKQRRKNIRGSYDFTVFFAVILLILFGIIMIFSSSYYYTLTSEDFHYDMFYFLKRQLIWSMLGIISMLIMMNFNYRLLKRLSIFAYMFANVCLVLVQIIGQRINGQKRWLGITDSLGFQPSEVAKIAVILFLSFYISSHKNCLGTRKGFFRCLFILGVPAVLIAISNFSTALVLVIIGGAIIFVASPKIWYFVVGGVFAVVGGTAAILFFPYRITRIKIWLDPFLDPTGDGYQPIQGFYAIASGGLFGLGLGQSRQKTFMPEAYNDMIFSIICEELGLFGAALVILLFSVLIWRGIRIAMNAVDMFGCLVAIGIVTMVSVQALINIGVVTGTIPNTGQPLPFISYGGTSLLFMTTSMGILLNISRYQRNGDR